MEVLRGPRGPCRKRGATSHHDGASHGELARRGSHQGFGFGYPCRRVACNAHARSGRPLGGRAPRSQGVDSKPILSRRRLFWSPALTTFPTPVFTLLPLQDLARDLAPKHGLLDGWELQKREGRADHQARVVGASGQASRAERPARAWRSRRGGASEREVGRTVDLAEYLEGVDQASMEVAQGYANASIQQLPTLAVTPKYTRPYQRGAWKKRLSSLVSSSSTTNGGLL